MAWLLLFSLNQFWLRWFVRLWLIYWEKHWRHWSEDAALISGKLLTRLHLLWWIRCLELLLCEFVPLLLPSDQLLLQQNLVLLQFFGLLVLLIPAPLIDLGLCQSGGLRHPHASLLAPVWVFLVLLHQVLHLTRVLSIPLFSFSCPVEC